MKREKPTKKEIAEERKKIKLLRIMVDLTTAILYQGNLSVPAALELVAATKKGILALFPDKESAYNLIYKPRFERIIKERLESN